MRFFLGLLLSLLSLKSLAVTRGTYTGMNLIVNISSNYPDGSVDGSPQELFAAMNRPEQPSMLGPGKSLEAGKKVLNFICVRKAENNYHCAIYIHKTAFSQIAPGKARFEVHGEQAQALFDQFHTQNGSYSFKDEDGKTGVWVTPERFVILYSEQGI